MKLRRTGRSRPALRCLTAGSVVLLGLLIQRAGAAEPFLEFIAGLRERHYYDTAQGYLDEISSRADLPADVRQVLPYERALTLLASAKDLTSSSSRRTQLDAAEAALEQFVQGAPDHVLAGQANSQRARIRMEKARVAIWDAEDPGNTGKKGEFQSEARQLISQARQIFEQALKKHEQEFRGFPLTIPEDDKVQRRRRSEAENRFLHAKLEVAECTYWVAQTYERGAKEREEQLTKAQEEYAEIHKEHRSQKVGLIARLWQGKCFEEMGRIGEALGIYQEILGHSGDDKSLQDLQARALWFRLICLNTDQKKDYRIVVDQATAWRNEAEGPLRISEMGRGIQFEMARALELLGSDRNEPEAQRNNYLTQALAAGRALGQLSDQFKAPAAALVRRVSALLKRPEDDPKTFDEAFGVGARYAEEIDRMQKQFAEAQANGDATAARELQKTIAASGAEMTRMLDLALRLAKPSTDAAQVATARSNIAFGYFLQKRYFEAAVAAEYAALHMPAKDDELARKAAYMVVAAYNYAYAAADPADRQFEQERTVAAAEALIARWPDSDYATDARNTIAKVFWNQGDKAQAAEWWAKVPTTAEDYAGSQIQAGQAYWTAHLEGMLRPEGERQPAETLTAWRAAAEQHLATGVAARQAQLPQEVASPTELVLGKITLAQIRNLNGVYTTQGEVTGALELLTAEPHAVISAVEVPPGERRPADSGDVRSAKIASLAYQTLLRTYIGSRDLEQASDTRAALEEVAAGEDSASLTQIYVEFGQALQRELDQLRSSGETDRLEDVRAGFEEFLNSLYERAQGHTFGSLLWVAETYTSLAEGSSDQPSRAEGFFAKAAGTYDKMLQDASIVSKEGQGTVIKLRLADCRRRQQDYAAAEPPMLEAVREAVNAPNVQFEAARLYQDWGASSGVNREQLQIAIQGKQDPTVWGWTGLVTRLQRELRKKPDDEKLQKMHIDSRYNLAASQRLLALQQSQETQRSESLLKARAGVETFVRIFTDLSTDDFRRFDELYAQILGDMGEPVVSLSTVIAQKPGAAVAVAGNDSRTSPTPTASEAVAPQPVKAAKPQSQTNYAMIIILVVIGATAVVGLYLYAARQSKRGRRPVTAPEIDDIPSFTPAPRRK